MNEAQKALILNAIGILYEVQYATPRMLAEEKRAQAISELQKALQFEQVKDLQNKIKKD